jgi:1-aminocyclopropane-1-carboxylate deaminase/D-cysteine desulfhydrase-like pyridoxal-dependent ACC family enzyme
LVTSLADASDLRKTIADRFDRVELAHLPTPLEEMKTLTEKIGGPNLCIKRDDQTGLAFGGNQARKLEYIFADLLARGELRPYSFIEIV